MRSIKVCLAVVGTLVVLTGCSPFGAGGGEQRWWIKTWPRGGGHCDSGVVVAEVGNG